MQQTGAPSHCGRLVEAEAGQGRKLLAKERVVSGKATFCEGHGVFLGRWERHGLPQLPLGEGEGLRGR